MGLFSTLILISAATKATAHVVGAVADAVEQSKRTPRREEIINISHEKPQPVIQASNEYCIHPTRSSNEYCDSDALDVAAELICAGFERIILKPVKMLGGHSDKYGKVRSVEISGDKDFYKQNKFPTTSYIIIRYMSFKDSVDPTLYNNTVQLIGDNVTVRSIDDIEKISKKPTPENDQSHSCPFCGETVSNEKARFCALCGEKL